MAATPKVKHPPTSSASEPDRTSTVVSVTLIGLTVLGVLTVFWEPLAALASGAPAADSVAETRAAPTDAGVSPTPSAAAPSTNASPTPADASGSS